MTKEEIQKNSEHWYNKYKDAEKHIAELKKQLDLKEKALSKAKKETKRIADRVNKDKRRLIRRKAELEQQIEKMKCCVVSCCEGCERLSKLYKEFENGNKEM